MAECLAFLRYLYLKALVAFSRFLLKLLTTTPSPKPDYVLQVPSRDKNRTVKVHVYKPHIEENAQPKSTPVLINLYGSGLAIPLHGADDDFCRLIAATTGHTVLDVNYCLAPEYPFPHALNDVEDILKYVNNHPTEYDTSRISISGFSSGGTLALAASTILPPGTFQSLIAFYPATNLFQDPGLRKAPVVGGKDRSPFWTRIFRESYIRGMDARDPRISPAFADTTNFPDRMLVVTGELDESAVEAEALAEKARDEGRAVGRDVVIRRVKGCGHAFDKKLTGEIVVSAKNETYDLAVEILRKS
ncbi:carboxylesterase [Penicillium angulare]|uniref:Carboxylesterase n=1 Tax=Penicillium angulare TaxID=116970 RepID=A0A9W9KRX9_9EURO|nr:carboxylesterase [Penicillium angulare]